MLHLTPIGVLSGTGFALPANTNSFLSFSSITNGVLCVQYGQGVTVDVTLNAGAAAVAADPEVLPMARVGLGGNTAPDSLLPIVLAALEDQSSASTACGFSTYLDGAASAQTQATVVAGQMGSTTFVYVANDAGLATYQLIDGALEFRAQTTDGPDNYGGNLSAMARVSVAGTQFLYTGSAQEHGIDVYEIGVNGVPVLVESVGVHELLPINMVTAISPLEVNGAQYLVVASAGSSSLSVLQIGTDGVLSVTDHVLDTRDTRFQNAAHVAGFEYDGHGFVLAAGSDDGLSLFALVEGGHLVHLQTVADTVGLSAADISGLHVQMIGAEAQVFVSSASEVGLTQFSLDLTALGDVRSTPNGPLQGSSGADVLHIAGAGAIFGQAGDDILCDGDGENTLHGGAGADIFLFRLDGQVDVIADFDVSEDRIDLSMIPMLYEISQMLVTYTSNGAILAFGTEVWDIRTSTNTPLTDAQIAGLGLGFGNHLSVSLGPAVPPVTGLTVQGDALSNRISGGGGDDRLLGLGGNDTLVGGDGHDTLVGGAGLDVAEIDALFANVTAVMMVDGAVRVVSTSGTDHLLEVEYIQFLDVLVTVSLLVGAPMSPTIGQDTLSGTLANDVIHALAGNDLVDGLLGADHISGGDGNDVLMGQLGDDTLIGDLGHDTLSGGQGDDVLRGWHFQDRLDGGAGHDDLHGDSGFDTLFGGSGNDTLRGGFQHDTLDGGLGHDTLYGDGGNDDMFGNQGDDILVGGEGHDHMRGGVGNDTLLGGAHNDSLFGQDGVDRLLGGWQNDALNGGAGNDALYGQSHNDLLNGDGGNDLLLGGVGFDTLVGGVGFDTLNGGMGLDTLTGGLGVDTFVFSDNFGTDVITDFDATSALERIDVSDLSAITSFVDLMSNHTIQTGANVRINDLAGNVVTLLGVSLGDLDASDFIF